MSKRKSEKASAQEVTSIFPSSVSVDEPLESKTEPRDSETPDHKKKILYPLVGITLFLLIVTGAMARNGWLPATDIISGKRIGWFGRVVPDNAPSNWNPASMLRATTAAATTTAAAVTTATPQLSKEYIYAGSRLLAVEDAAANAAAADLGVWRPGTGSWYVLSSSTGSPSPPVQFGASGDKPVQGDYNGDGKTDLALFRPSNGTWYFLTSDGYTFRSNFGEASDIPVTGDYDGDGKSDLAFFRPSNGNWYLLTSAGYTITNFGAAGDIPLTGDYNGDGKSDFTVFRPSNGTWYFLTSDGYTLNGFGESGDIAVPSDYDGDGRADIAVWRSSNGT